MRKGSGVHRKFGSWTRYFVRPSPGDGKEVAYGNIYGKKYTTLSVGQWVECVWGPVLGYTLTFHYMVKVKLGFSFKMKRDVEIILKNKWYWGH